MGVGLRGWFPWLSVDLETSLALKDWGHCEQWVRDGSPSAWGGPFLPRKAQAPRDQVFGERLRSPETVLNLLMAWPHPGADDC